METDLTSIIIGIAALSTFFIPIGMYKISQRRKLRTTLHLFRNFALNYGLRIDDVDILRDGIAIGIDFQNKILLHVIDRRETLMDLSDVQSCSLFKHQRKVTGDDGTVKHILTSGIQVKLIKSQTRELQLPLFIRKGGGTFGDEEIVIHKWIVKIKTALVEHSGS